MIVSELVEMLEKMPGEAEVVMTDSAGEFIGLPDSILLGAEFEYPDSESFADEDVVITLIDC